MNPVYLKPGEDVQVYAPTGETLTVGRNSAKTRARVTASGTAPVPPPTEPPDPVPTGKVLAFGPSLKAATLMAALDDDIDIIELSGGTYELGSPVWVDVDRSSRPLTIRKAAGATVIFRGSGEATAYAPFFFGLARGTETQKTAKHVTLDGIAFDGYLLAQAGVLELRYTDHISLLNLAFRNITIKPTSDTYKSWAAYISRVNSNVRADNWLVEGYARGWSGIQIDSGTSAASVHLTNMTMKSLAFAFYENVPTTDLLLDTWDVRDCDRNGTSISFHQSVGLYRNIALTGSGGIAVNGSGMKAA